MMDAAQGVLSRAALTRSIMTSAVLAGSMFSKA
jgi:hypothetical protein